MFGLREAEIEGILLCPESAVILADHPEMAWFRAESNESTQFGMTFRIPQEGE